MANRVKGEVSAEFEGVTYTARLDFNAMCDFEEATGKAPIEVMKGFEKGEARMADLRHLMFAALRQVHSDATLQLAGRILTAHPQLLLEAIVASFGEAEEGQDAAGGKPTKPRRA